MLIEEIKSQYAGVACHCTEGTQVTIIGLVGDTSHVDMDSILAHQDIVEQVTRVQEPYKMVNHQISSAKHSNYVGQWSANRRQSGGGYGRPVFGGIRRTDHRCRQKGQILRRSYSPRRGIQTSYFSICFPRFAGRRGRTVAESKEATGLPIVSEVMSAAQIPLFQDVDIIQVGARNMQNFELLKELGHLDKPILLKRGLSSTIEEWLMSAEYIMAGGNERVILCERGIRTYETFTRNTLDISAVPILKHLTHLPVVVDPSHGTGITWLVEPMAKSRLLPGRQLDD